jgi:hypothetical protein
MSDDPYLIMGDLMASAAMAKAYTCARHALINFQLIVEVKEGGLDLDLRPAQLIFICPFVRACPSSYLGA